MSSNPTLSSQPAGASSPDAPIEPVATQASSSRTAPPAIRTAYSPTATTAPPAIADWPMYHRDNARTGYLADFPDPKRLSVAWNASLDGDVYAEPIIVNGHVIVATEGDSLYSLSAATGQIEWRTNIGQPVPRSSLPCGNINPLGITGTPVYDPATGLVFAVAEVTGPAHILVGVDLATGAIRVRRSADAPGMSPAPHQQRGALALLQGMVYIPFGGLYGDCGNYHGTVVASRTDASGPLLTYQVPTAREGGIWAPPGPIIDAQGDIFVSVGNGAETGSSWDHSDSVLRLSAALALKDGFAPEQWAQDNARDADLGSLGPVLLPDNLIFIAGKAGIGYLLHAGALGGVGGQATTKTICHAYGGAAVVASTIYLPCNEGLQQVQITAGPNVTLGWHAPAPGSPVVGGHTVYNVDRNGTLYALNAETGQARATVSIGATSRFATPSLSQGRIFIGTMTGVVAVTGS